jgi:hypothetical protein
LTGLLDFRDGYYARSGLLDHVNHDGFDYWSDRLLHFPRISVFMSKSPINQGLP